MASGCLVTETCFTSLKTPWSTGCPHLRSILNGSSREWRSVCSRRESETSSDKCDFGGDAFTPRPEGLSLPEAHAGLLGGFSQGSIFTAQHEFSSLRQLEVGGVVDRQLVNGSQL